MKRTTALTVLFAVAFICITSIGCFSIYYNTTIDANTNAYVYNYNLELLKAKVARDAFMLQTFGLEYEIDPELEEELELEPEIVPEFEPEQNLETEDFIQNSKNI